MRDQREADHIRWLSCSPPTGRIKRVVQVWRFVLNAVRHPLKLGLKGEVDLLHFPAATHTFALAEHRHALASDLLRWPEGFTATTKGDIELPLGQAQSESSTNSFATESRAAVN